MAVVSRFTLWLEESMFRHGGLDYHYSDLAREIGVSKNTISAWKTKKKTPRREHIHLLAIHFGVTSRFIYELLDKTPPRDLKDTYEKIAAIVYSMTHIKQAELLDELEVKRRAHNGRAEVNKKAK